MTHKELVKIAGEWLSNAKGCNPVFMEKGSSHLSEIPDAIGWDANGCTIVECKTTKADLVANAKKTITIGKYRYFLMTQELYKECESTIPEHWGVVTVYPRYYQVYPRQVNNKSSDIFESELKHEIHYLRSRLLSIQNYGRP